MASAKTSVLGLGLLFAGAAVDSTSGLFTRVLPVDAFTTASGRGFIAFAFLLTVLAIRERGRVIAPIMGLGVWGAAFVAVNGSGMVLNILSLKLTAVANFFMIFATAPFIAAVLGRIVLKEKLDLATMLAAVAGFVGIAVMMLGGTSGGVNLGDVLALVVVLTYAAIVLIVRRAGNLDILPLCAVTALASGLIALPFADFSGMASRDWQVLGALGVFQLAIGNLLIFSAVARIPAAQGGLLGILIAGFAPLWVFLVLGEIPPPATLYGGAIILGAAVLHLIWTIRAARKPLASAPG
jgi:drug/metabolite transporter (DMT)-like permease